MPGAIVPLALGVAMSPAVVLAAIMMMMSTRPRRSSGGLALGWAAAIVLAVSVFAILTSTVWAIDPNAAAVMQGVTGIAVGSTLVMLAAIQWAIRPKRGQPRLAPGWLRTVDRLDAHRAAALGFAVLIANPKNLALTAAAGMAIGASSTGWVAVGGVRAFLDHRGINRHRARCRLSDRGRSPGSSARRAQSVDHPSRRRRRDHRSDRARGQYGAHRHPEPLIVWCVGARRIRVWRPVSGRRLRG